MNVSIFRALLFFLVLGLFGCSDRLSDGDPWTLGSDDGEVDMTSSSDPDPEPDPDAAASADTRQESTDAGSPDAADPGDVRIAVDAGFDVAPDVGPDFDAAGMVTATGWYSSAFEHSGFVPDGEPLNIDAGCDPYLWSQPPGENWWTYGAVIDQARSLVTGGGSISRIRATGTVTEEGQYGHLGAYDREFVIESGEVLACETAARVGHCVFPRSGDRCVIPAIETIDPPTKRSHLKVTHGGPAGSGISYELRVIHNENVGDGREDVVVRWRLDGQQDPSLVRIEDLVDPRLTLEVFGIGFFEYEYGDLEGWVGYAPTGIEAWLVSMSGTRDDGEELHVWGFFTVDEVEYLP